MNILIGTWARHSSPRILLRTLTPPAPFTHVVQSWGWFIFNKKVNSRPRPLDYFPCLSICQNAKSVIPILMAQTGSITSNFPSCIPSAGGGRCRKEESWRTQTQIRSERVTRFLSAESPSLLPFPRRQSLLPPQEQATACSKLLLTQIPCCLVLLFVSHIIHIFLSYMHFS